MHAKKDQTGTMMWILMRWHVAASGASGAELANMVNEAALRAVSSGRTYVNQADLEESIEVVIAGYQKKNAVLSDKEKLIVSYHETRARTGSCTADSFSPGYQDYDHSAYFRCARLYDAGGGT